MGVTHLNGVGEGSMCSLKVVATMLNRLPALPRKAWSFPLHGTTEGFGSAVMGVTVAPPVRFCAPISAVPNCNPIEPPNLPK